MPASSQNPGKPWLRSFATAHAMFKQASKSKVEMSPRKSNAVMPDLEIEGGKCNIGLLLMGP